MLINMRNAMLSGGKRTPTAKDYVQDGLVAMWDGIENAGWGVHDANVTEWKDLVGGVFGDLPISSAGLDSVFWSQFSGFKKDVDFSMPVTIEIMIRSCNMAFFNIGSPPNYLSLLNNGGYLTYSTYSNKYEFYSKTGRSQVLKSCLNGFPLRIVYDSGTCSLYANNVFAASHSNTNTTSSWGSFSIGAYANGKLTCEACFIRLYSRALTADEIAANYTVDKARFNLP